MRHRAWALLLLVPTAVLVVAVLRAPFPTFHQHLSLAGTPDRFAATVVRAGRADARGALWLDNLLVVTFLAVVPRLLRIGLARWAPERRHQFGWWYLAPRCAVAAGVLDLVENGVALSLVGRQRPSTGLTLLVTTVCWAKWPLYVAAGVGVLGLVVGPVLMPVLSRLGWRRQDAVAGDPAAERIGIVVVGDGPGALHDTASVLAALDRPVGGGRSLVSRAIAVVTVGTGRDAFATWRGDDPRAQRRRNLVEGSGRVTVIVAGLVLVALAAGSALGLLVRTRALHAWFPAVDPSAEARLRIRDLVPLRLVVPPAAWLGGALAAAAWAMARRDVEAHERAMRWARRLAGVGGALALITVGVPTAVRYLPGLVGHLDIGALPGGALLALLAACAFVLSLRGTSRATIPRDAAMWRRIATWSLGTLFAIVVAASADAVAWRRGDLWASIPVPGTEWRLPWIVPAALWLVLMDRFAVVCRPSLAGRRLRPYRLGSGSSNGGWVPNPRFPAWFADDATAPRLHLGYLAKELLGHHTPTTDPFVHLGTPTAVDELGVVSALADRPDTLVIVDGSDAGRDRTDAFARSAELARSVLDAEVRIAGEPTPGGIVIGSIVYADGSAGRILTGPADRIVGLFEGASA